MKQIKQYIAVAAAAMLLPSMAQALSTIDFESADSYKAIDVYDCWEESPFRTGVLKGNVAVCPNPDKSLNEATGLPANESEYVLGAQRSRFAGNRFGVRIDLPETFELTTTTQYVHVMIHKPKEGRVMLVGLGSRTERLAQNPYTEQFWETSVNTIPTDKWVDAVFAIKGAGGIDVRSLVVVPDCESPHALTSDFIFYVDDVVINSSPTPRVSYEYYTINLGEKSTLAMTRTDRYSTAISISGSSDGAQSIALDQASNKTIYKDCTSQMFTAKPGDQITPAVAYSGTWMNAFCYIDYNNDGRFEPVINTDGSLGDGNELVAFSFVSKSNYDSSASGDDTGVNSNGTTVSGSSRNSMTMPAFTLPADLTPGMYRIRFKVDWASSDPGGNTDSSNLITDNGGVIADAMLCVHGSEITVNDFQLNGEVLTADGQKLDSYKTACGQDFKVKMAPEKGFEANGLTVYYGFNLSGDQLDKHGNTQWFTAKLARSEFDDEGIGTIPASAMMGGEARIEGNMAEQGTLGEQFTMIPLNFDSNLTFSRTDRHLNAITLTSPSRGAQKVTADDSTPYKVYTQAFDTVVEAVAGETISGTIDYTGRAMHGYLYIDWGKDNELTATINEDGTPADGSDLVSYSFYEKKNSLGESFDVAGGANEDFWTKLPNFTVDANRAPGDYYARFIMDWNALYPGGQYGFGSNNIDDNGGGVLDFTFRVSALSSIDEISAAAPAQTGLTYDLTGRRVNPDTARHGVYIRDGKKIIIK
jgi:hypothetical protein